MLAWRCLRQSRRGQKHHSTSHQPVILVTVLSVENPLLRCTFWTLVQVQNNEG
jgi:hypothetical protein